jgi:hypothetical protein
LRVGDGGRQRGGKDARVDVDHACADLAEHPVAFGTRRQPLELDE